MIGIMRIVAVSDTHGFHRKIAVPHGDILVHAGDFTVTGSLRDVSELNDFLGRLPHPTKIVIAGNHDWCFQKQPAEARARLTNAVYLQDEAAEVGGLGFYGSPWQPWFYDWAFNLERGSEIRAKWELISNLVQFGADRKKTIEIMQFMEEKYPTYGSQ